MPEGDTIHRTAAAMRERLRGKTVVAARPEPLARLRGHALLDVDATGKHCTLRFDGGIALHTHMRMTGSWHLYRPGQRWRRARWQATCVLEFDTDVAVLFAAPVCELVPDDGSAVSHLGPDILADDADVGAIARRARDSGAQPIGEVLLDQRLCAGIGNIYRCETLWLRRLDPWTPVDALDEAELVGCYRTARDLMRQSLLGTRFAPPRAVHARGGRPCRRCGTPIAVRPLGAQARLVYWCPRCQPPHAAAAAVD